MGRYDEALRVINESLARWSEKDLAFENVLREELLFWKGRILYRNNEYDEAASFFEQSLQLSKKLPRTRYRDFYAASAYY
jgi:tetratricopeptide (TPR) repeat protein